MRLTIGNERIALPLDANIEIEKTSPILNEDTGTYSYPFPVPTRPNQQKLGWAGKLERVGEIPDKTFILEEQGLQILRGEIDYDQITEDETGLILKSGYTEFFTKYSKVDLNTIDFGSEWWPAGYPDAIASPSFGDKLREWDLANTTNNGIFVVSPFKTQDDFVNTQWWSGPSSTYLAHSANTGWEGRFCLQFYVNFVLKKLFEETGYSIISNEFENSEFNKAILFGKIINFKKWDTTGVIFPSNGGSAIIVNAAGSLITPVFADPRGSDYGNTLYYSYLMPDMKITEFLNTIKIMFGLYYDINEIRKEVSIQFLKNIFQNENRSGIEMKELKGWSHEELKPHNGLALRYTSQDEDLDTKYDYKPDLFVDSTLPNAGNYTADQVCHVNNSNRDYQLVLDNGTNTWKEVGRLKEFRTGDGENVLEIPVNVPGQYLYLYQSIWLECPYLKNVIRLMQSQSGYYASNNQELNNIPLTISLYHGRKTFAGLIQYPYCTFDRYSYPGLATFINTGINLKPEYLYTNLYQSYLDWKTYHARFFTKMMSLTLPQLIALQWNKRYVVNGIDFILNKINYQLPHRGIVKIEGYTIN